MTTKPNRVSPQARQEATEWFVTLREGETDASIREAFYAWVRRSPDNVHAYIRILTFWEDTELLAKSDLFDRNALMARAREESNVIPLSNGERVDPFLTGSKRGRAAASASGARWLAIAASILVAVLASGSVYWYTNIHNTYATGVGDQRRLTLPDGSTIDLNARSRIHWAYTEHERDIQLLEGQAFFRVAKDGTRPFVVDSNGTKVRAVGTQFDVYRKDVGTIVTVVEGTVALRQSAGAPSLGPALQPAAGSPIQARPGEILIAAGEQLTVTTAGSAKAPRSLRVHKTNPEIATAWTQGKLIFDETLLSDVVAEFNRYSTRRLIISDPELLAFHISGTFPSSDPIRIAEFLQARFGVKIEQTEDEIRIRKNE